MEPIILASSSQRRQEIFKQLGIPYMVVMPEIKEDYPDDLSFENIPEYLASQWIQNYIYNTLSLTDILARLPKWKAFFLGKASAWKWLYSRKIRLT